NIDLLQMHAVLLHFGLDAAGGLVVRVGGSVGSNVGVQRAVQAHGLVHLVQQAGEHSSHLIGAGLRRALRVLLNFVLGQVGVKLSQLALKVSYAGLELSGLQTRVDVAQIPT